MKNKFDGVHILKKNGKLKWLWLLCFAPAALILNLAATSGAGFAEWYAVTIYPYLSRAINLIASLFPFSLAEILVAAFFISIIVSLIIYVIKIIRGKGKRREITARYIATILCTLSILYFSYTVSCGINYSRYTFARTSGLKVRPSSKEELTALCNELADKVNALRKQVGTDGRQVMKLRTDLYETGRQARDAYDKIHIQYPLLTPGYSVPKPLLSSRLFSYGNITGIFIPFTFEANINKDVPDYIIPATMCHELSHLRGFMREDEANFIGYLVCKNSGTPDFEYSGYMSAFVYASNALYGTDRDAASGVYAKLSSGVLRDLTANTEYWRQFEGPVSETVNAVNDTYLKVNHQEAGVKSYGNMVDLLLAEYRADHTTK